MFQYIKMKKMEHKLKSVLYSYASALLAEKADIIRLVENLYAVLKDTDVNELRNTFIREIAALAHEEAIN